MSKHTEIQWCDSTVNPIMGCGGCELFPAPGIILEAIQAELRWEPGTAKRMFAALVAKTWEENFVKPGRKPGPGHINGITTTNIYHLRFQFEDELKESYDKKTGAAGRAVIEACIKCYAAKLHLNKACSIVNPERKANKGYASSFEQVKQFPGRMKEAAKWSDLFGTDRPAKPWLAGLARLIFVSDMGDALSGSEDIKFLQDEMSEVSSEHGKRHLWLWLTKRPRMMAQFAESIGGMPENVCAMTTITSAETLSRVDELRKVNARVRALSVEPLWTRISRSELNLDGIDWVIVGGESGAVANVNPFCLEWAEELRSICDDQGVSFFLKQLGRRPTRDGREIRLRDTHGGYWDEWSAHLQTREVPAYFKSYRNRSLL